MSSRNKTDRARDLRNYIAELLADFVPGTDASRAIRYLDELVEMTRHPKEN